MLLGFPAFQAAGEANGPLLQHLAATIAYHDPFCVELLRQGCDIVGVLTRSGNGKPLEVDVDSGGTPGTENLSSERAQNNKALLRTLKEDKHAAELLRMATEDAEKGRMSHPRPLAAKDIAKHVLSPRFCVEQGGLRLSHGQLHIVLLPLQGYERTANLSCVQWTTLQGPKSMHALVPPKS